MSQQLTLRVGLSDQACFENFHPGGNAEALLAVREIAGAGEGLILVHGEPGSGKTHLLYAAQKAALESGRLATYFSLLDRSAVQRLSGFADYGDLICLDDVGCVAGELGSEKLLFNLIEQRRQGGGAMLMAANDPPRRLSIFMPDLVSRMTSGLTYRLLPLTDEHRTELMRLRARHRGIELSDEVIAYVLRRYPRDSSALFQLLDRIDKQSLTTKRRVTIPFIKELESAGN